MTKKNYNTTDLIPETAFERHVYHRDMFAHYLRWSHILKVLLKSKGLLSVCDFGCGRGSLAEVIYRNRCNVKQYTGLDIRNSFDKRLLELPWVTFIKEDIIQPLFGFSDIKADIVTSFEVAEHIGKQNIKSFLKHFKQCGHKDSTYYISTPVYDENVGAAGNHTFDSGDGRGVAPQEFQYEEFKNHLIEAGFTIEKTHGTFASIKDYKDKMQDHHLKVFNELSEYYDTNILSVLMAPMFPEFSRNCIWILKQN
jgi:SAM-dependent methyltransferase